MKSLVKRIAEFLLILTVILATSLLTTTNNSQAQSLTDHSKHSSSVINKMANYFSIPKLSSQRTANQQPTIQSRKLNTSNKRVLKKNLGKIQVTHLSSNLNNKSIKKKVSTSAQDESQSVPIAGLGIGTDNPDSEINGNFTTNSNIDFFLSYDGTNYSYDPSGEALTQFSAYIFPDEPDYSYLPIVDENNNVIGFPIKFNHSGEFVLPFEVENSSGVWSAPIYPQNDIEPADGSNRPVLNTLDNPVTTTTQVGLPFNVSWQGAQS
ncbi:MAG: hypothetical protein ABF651_04395 [Sporolactobacillus sp.]